MMAEQIWYLSGTAEESTSTGELSATGVNGAMGTRDHPTLFYSVSFEKTPLGEEINYECYQARMRKCDGSVR